MATETKEIKSEAGAPTAAAPPTEVQWYTVLNAEMNHRGFQFKLGLNVLTQEWRPDLEFGEGGLYCTTDPHEFISYGTKLARVSIPTDAKTVVFGNNMKCDRLVIETIQDVPEKVYLAAVEENGLAFSMCHKNVAPKRCVWSPSEKMAGPSSMCRKNFGPKPCTRLLNARHQMVQ